MLSWIVILLISILFMHWHMNIFFIMLVDFVRPMSFLHVVMSLGFFWIYMICLMMAVLMTLKLFHPPSSEWIVLLVMRLIEWMSLFESLIPCYMFSFMVLYSPIVITLLFHHVMIFVFSLIMLSQTF